MSQEKELRDYFIWIVAILVLSAAAIGSFFYGLLKASPEDVEDIVFGDEEEIIVDPAEVNVPSYPPNVPAPTTPPPTQ